MTKDGLPKAFHLTREAATRHAPPKSPAPSAWFLGPHAENKAHLMDLAELAVEKHAWFRQTYKPKDPQFATDGQLDSASHKETLQHTRDTLEETLDLLCHSIPLASYRNQSHMYWDLTMPASAGYFAGMLFNQNNVAAEASPVTTSLEIHVAEDLCRMLGYDLASDPAPWGHITCDGSVANCESMWSARNLRFHAVAAAAALEEDPALKPACDVTVKTGDGRRARLLDLTRWEQMNLPVTEILSLHARMAEVGGLDEGAVGKALGARTVQRLGLLTFYQRYLSTIREAPVILVPALAHYSWEKAGAILGMGLGAVHTIEIDHEGRMKMPALRAALEDALKSHRPVVQVVAVTGTTGEGAVDPVADILAIREEYQERGLSFAVHADGAWGGYFASLLRAPRKNTVEDPEHRVIFDECPWEHLTDHARHHMSALGGCDSITVDPHKGGFVPYPAGALCYRDNRMPGLVMHTSPVVFHGGAAPTVGVNGIEGSKPGAAAVATYMSHRVIPPDASGYGRLLGRCIYGATRYYAAVVTLADDTTPYTLTPVIRLPSERRGDTPVEIRAERECIRTEIVPRSNAELEIAFSEDPSLEDLFTELGPDLTVFAYLANFKTADGVNTDHALMNELNDEIFKRCSLQTEEAEAPSDRDLFLTQSAYDPAATGAAFTDALATRAGAEPVGGLPVSFLISTCQNPWITSTAHPDDPKKPGFNMIPLLMEALDREIRSAVDHVVTRHGLPPFVPPRG